MLLCSFAGYEFPGVVMMGGTQYVYGFFCVSFVWCGVNVWIFIVGCQSRMGGGWSFEDEGTSPTRATKYSDFSYCLVCLSS